MCGTYTWLEKAVKARWVREKKRRDQERQVGEPEGLPVGCSDALS